MKSCRFLLRYSLVILVGFASLQAQSERELKLAETLAKAGDYTHALELYLRFYRSGNESVPVISGIKSAYENLSRFDELILFLEEIIRKQPGNFNYQIDLATACYQNRQMERAMQIWKTVYSQKPPDLMRYRLVASAMVKVRLFDEAITVYNEAIENLKNQEALYLDIATLYRALLNYEEAVHNYLMYYQYFEKRFSYIQSMILSMTRDDDSTDRILTAVSRYLKNHPGDLSVKELQAGLYIKKKDFQHAFDIFSQLEEKDRKPQYLLKFAGEAEQNAAYDFAIRTLNLILEHPGGTEDSDQLRLKLARNYYKLGAVRNDQDLVMQALSILQSLDKGPVYYSGLELTGDIYHSFYYDYDKAIEAYDALLKSLKKGDTANRIWLRTGRSYFMKNDTRQSVACYRNIRSGPYLQEALYHIARITFYEGRFTEAENQFSNLINRLSMIDSLTNNAIEYLLLLEQNRADSTALAKFAAAEMLHRQDKFSEAAEKYADIVPSGTSLGLTAGLRAARLFDVLKAYDKSEVLLNEMLLIYEGEKELDEVYFILGTVYQNQDKREQALEIFRKLLGEFPDSFYLEPARELARTLSVEPAAEYIP